MIKRITASALVALALTTGGALAAGGGEQHIEDFAFSFEGPFGKFDQNQLQRGLKVYTEVCSACHGLKFVSFRTLGDPGGPALPADQVKAYASEFPINDELSNPQYFDKDKEEYRTLTTADKFPIVDTDAAGPDLSLMAKARAGFHGPYGLGVNQVVKGMGGPEYIASLLTGYTGEEKEEAGTVFYENTAFPGGWIAMAPPLYGEDVDFDDGHSNDLHHEAEDIAAFLMWSAEPKMMARKQAGLTGVLFLTLLSVLLYLTNKRLWKPVKTAAKKD